MLLAKRHLINNEYKHIVSSSIKAHKKLSQRFNLPFLGAVVTQLFFYKMFLFRTYTLYPRLVINLKNYMHGSQSLGNMDKSYKYSLELIFLNTKSG